LSAPPDMVMVIGEGALLLGVVALTLDNNNG
jgi:hypothetical protein